MREIKFRAWDKEKKEMVYGVWISPDGEPAINEGHDRWYPLEKLAMQYTGLKDKNGKEIWEGDIVRELKDSWIEVVEWDDMDSGFKPFNDHREVPIAFEIIGNIYENPELINEVTEEERFGWTTNKKTRPKMLDEWAEALRKREVVIYDKEALIDE